jgi:hypothetical protein
MIFGNEKYTTEELNARLKFFIGIVLGLTLFGIVFVVLYSLIFVTQPMNGMSPVDNKFFELIIPIATFLTGTLSGIMLAGGDKELQAKALDAANRPSGPSSPSPAPVAPRPVTPAPLVSGTLNVPVGAGSVSVSASVPSPLATKAAPPPAPQPEL